MVKKDYTDTAATGMFKHGCKSEHSKPQIKNNKPQIYPAQK